VRQSAPSMDDRPISRKRATNMGKLNHQMVLCRTNKTIADSGGSRNFQPGIHLANLVFILKKHHYFCKIIAILPCVEKNLGIHLNTREYPWCRP
jgi:hypothetical protein